MKKKLLLILSMFIFITNVNALTFDVNVTNIEDKGNGGTIGSIENIDVNNKELDALFQDIGDEVSFEITVTNEGDRAGTLRSISFESENDKIEYTSNIPAGGLAINGNDTNKVIVTAKVLPGIVNGRTSTLVKIKYTYDEGSCPDGEILSDDESMCLCPDGMERNEQGICVEPEKKIECADDEIYNEQKKICEKKVVPVVPGNPKTLDNIVLITLLFIVSGLGIYAAMFKRLKTDKKKITGGVVTGVITLSAAFITLASVFGLDNLLGAIINPITKEKELVIKVNEEIDLIETWDGVCDLDTTELTPENIFEDGSGTQADPYQVKTAEQLSCFAKSVTNDVTYEGQYVKQIKHIKLNDHLNDQATSGDLSNANVWKSAGYGFYNTTINNDENHPFKGEYDGDNYIISGMYITDDSKITSDSFVGLFGNTYNATLKNIKLSDVYMNVSGHCGGIVGYAVGSLTMDNITTYGNGNYTSGYFGSGGMISRYNDYSQGILKIENSTNNINLTCTGICSGIIETIDNPDPATPVTLTEPNIIFNNNTNNGSLTVSGSSIHGISGLYGQINYKNHNILIDNNANNGEINIVNNAYYVGGIIGSSSPQAGQKFIMKNSYNTGNINGTITKSGGLAGWLTEVNEDGIIIENCYNSGNLIDPKVGNDSSANGTYVGGIVGQTADGVINFKSSFNTGNISIGGICPGGIVGDARSNAGGNSIEDSFNTGDITSMANKAGGLFGQFQNGDISRSYNTGTITIFGNNSNVSGLGDCIASRVYNSYNEGEIISNGFNSNLGGLCGSYPDAITNSYNRGNITSKNAPSNVGGISAFNANITNSYNSGDITILSESEYITSYSYVGGISQSSYVPTKIYKNVYNLGNILIHQNGGTNVNTIYAAGIDGGNPAIGYNDTSGLSNVSNSVNKGNITIKINQPYTTSKRISIAGIITGSPRVSGCFNSGILTIDDSALDTPIINDGNNHNIFNGEITTTYKEGSTNNKFKNSSGFALGCYQRGECTLEESQAVGISTEEDVPSILSIINGDDAFEIKSGESLPTLKVFN